MIEPYLDNLEKRITPEIEDALQAEWESFTEGHFGGEIFSPRRTAKSPPGIAWPQVSVNRAQVDPDAMVLQQYGVCSEHLAQGSGGLMMVRANFGTGIMPTLFGAELFIMDESHDTLQTTKPLGAQAMEALVERGIPPMEAGLGATVLATGRRFAEIARQYPKIGKYVQIYHPDMQGPMDICELLWGSELFIDLIDRPELVHRVLGLLTDTYALFMREWNRTVGTNGKEWAGHWSMMHKGKLMLRTQFQE